MLRENQTVFAHGRQVKIGLIFREWARCCRIDQHGAVHLEWFDLSSLVPVHQALRPRSKWPESGNLDAVELAGEERAARIEALAERAAARRKKRRRR